ncbi:MAG TPA: heavy metal translocating P-type ATPase [Xanthobacteraceae bacterium]|nr:heavy metal translocating P-type ATPase [Xanthobacteraceae bacterium]
MFSELSLHRFFIVFPVVGIALGFALQFLHYETWASVVWGGSTLPVLLLLIVDIVRSLRRGQVGLDIVAALSMTAALVFGEELAAAVVAVMYSGGQFLENFAERHARREMTALLGRVPRTTMRHRDGKLEEVALDLVSPADRLLIRQGDVVPVDGKVAKGLAVLDQSALTGESIPVQRKAGEVVMSGSTNVGDAFDLAASRRAAESTYAGIVRLVETAQQSKAPMSRLADRFAMVFLVITVALASGAWIVTGDPIRGVAVLVIATPCPLILAVPVAIVSGLSLAARHGILIKGGKALEMMARIRALVIDKTGTLTDGRARVAAIHAAPGFSENDVLRIAASLDQGSKHVIAQTIVSEARRRKLRLAVPADMVETPGEGLEGNVDGHRAVVGGPRFVASRNFGMATVPRQPRAVGDVVVALAVDGQWAGTIVLSDPLRAGTDSLLLDLRNLGIERIVLATGDRREVADAIVKDLSIDAVRSELTPDQKVMVVLSERKNGPVMMVGDGVNDAPALAAADIGLAMGARGAAASAEAADVVLLIDRLDRVAPAIRIARRARTIALESVYVGIGLSVIGMIAAALGHLTPVQGALLQELIDVAVILNALRVLKAEIEP